MTICWNVDDMKISHVDPKAVEKVVSWLDKLYPGITATRGKIHYYLGMTFDSSIPDEVRVSMDDYIEKDIEGFPERIFETESTQAADHLFKIRDKEERKALPEDQGSMYHHVVSQLLFAAFRVRRDIQTAVVFLTIWVKAPDKDDRGKLK